MSPGDKVYFPEAPRKTRRIWTVTSVNESAGTCNLYTNSGDARRMQDVSLDRLRPYPPQKSQSVNPVADNDS